HFSLKKCEAEFLRAVHPSDQVAVKLRKHLLEACGDIPVWLNARSDGTKFVWEDTKTELSREDDLWLKGDPTSIFDRIWHYLDERISSNYCLNLAVWFENWSERPRRVYASSHCKTKFYTLCEECPVGFLRLEGSRQCFKLLTNSTLTWWEAQRACLDRNLVLAIPSDEVAVALRKLILDKYGEGYLWLDGMARADSGRMMWQRTHTELRSNHTLWQYDEPDFRDKRDTCLVMDTANWTLSVYPAQPYTTILCTGTGIALCE
ncbi:unnamed protein product, partial [Meganyctiphanes norvegica]